MTPRERNTVLVNANTPASRFEVTCDADGLTSRAGTALLTGLCDAIGLTAALVGTVSSHSRSVRHEPGRIVRDIAVMLADGGDCLSDLGALRGQRVLFGEVASASTVYRAAERLDGQALTRIREARALARARVWDIVGAPGRIVLDIDATLVTSHSDKERAAGTYKRGFGFHPLTCFEATTGEGLAGILRPGNAGANTATDHVAVLDLALAQLPRGAAGPGTLVRCDSAGATHAFLDAVAAHGLLFSVGFDLTQRVREACLAVPGKAWRPALDASGGTREGAWVAELDLDLSTWPQGTRAICRRERPHPGAQLTFTDDDGHRFQVFLTNQTGSRIARLEQLHRSRAAIEDSIRCAKASGLRNLPFRAFSMNEAWLELVLMGCDLVAWTRMLLLSGTPLAKAEPKRLRYRLLHVAGRIVTHARGVRLRLSRSWPWADVLLTAFQRLRALPEG
ncbi:MAG: IS1380 family transposase [Actinomycetota bacterium]|nr:IS1380 family transposase [Actinomycetota bacterium]